MFLLALIVGLVAAVTIYAIIFGGDDGADI